jgi:hypothetical protein
VPFRFYALVVLFLTGSALKAQGSYVATPYAFGATASRALVGERSFYSFGAGLTARRAELGLALTPETESAPGAFGLSAGFYFLREPEGLGTAQLVVALERAEVERSSERVYVFGAGPAFTLALVQSPRGRIDLDALASFVAPFHESATPGFVLGAGAGFAVGPEQFRVFFRPAVAYPLQEDAETSFSFSIGVVSGFRGWPDVPERR